MDTDDEGDLVKTAFERDFWPSVRSVIDNQRATKELNIAAVQSALEQAARKCFQSRQIKFVSVGIRSPHELLQGYFLPMFQERNREIPDRFGATGVDPAILLELIERDAHGQIAVDVMERQQTWDVFVERLRPVIPESKQWDQHLQALAARLRKLGNFPAGEYSDSQAVGLLWSLVFISILEKTGPARLNQNGRPRKIADVLEFGHLTDRLKGEFRDDAAIQGAKSDGTTGAVRRVVEEEEREVHGAESARDIEDAADGAQIAAYMEEALDPKDLKMLRMWQDDRTQQEIADVLGCSQSTVSKRIAALIEHLSARFGEKN